MIKPKIKQEINQEKKITILESSKKTLKNKTKMIDKLAIKTASILVIEDNDIDSKITHNLLKKMGHKITLAEDGEAALNAVKKEQFQLIFTDIQLPALDGFEISKLLRQQGHTMPIIAISSISFKEFSQKRAQGSINDYLPKPVRKKALASMIAKWLKHPESIRNKKSASKSH